MPAHEYHTVKEWLHDVALHMNVQKHWRLTSQFRDYYPGAESRHEIQCDVCKSSWTIPSTYLLADPSESASVTRKLIAKDPLGMLVEIKRFASSMDPMVPASMTRWVPGMPVAFLPTAWERILKGDDT